jgi:hypothetical protein
MKAKPALPQLGARVTASGYMVRYSTMKAWRARNPDESDSPASGFKTWRRAGKPFAGIYVGFRVLTIKHWWMTCDDGEEEWGSHRTPITFYLIAYSTRAKLRYVLPQDVEVTQ